MAKLTLKEEIIQALLDRKKIRQGNWYAQIYIHFVNGVIVNQEGYEIDTINLDDDWELYTPTVTFFEALEAMKEGKMAMREDNILNSTCPICFGEKDCLVLYKTNSVYTITKKDLISKWQILEGDENGIN